jgi:phosphate transport system substrate-binding protein
MKVFGKGVRLGAALAALALVGAACSSDETSAADGGGSPAAEGLTGSVSISGSSTVEPISALVAELFNEANPDVEIRVDGPGTSDGFELFCAGDTDISDASRPIDEEEIAACEEAGISWLELEVALDALTVMGNPANSLSCLNLGDLYSLFGPQSEGIDTWDGADQLASEVGGNGGFPALSLDITAPGEESGTYDAFLDLSTIPDIGEEQGLSEDEAEALRKDYTASPNDNVIITAMGASDGALGFVGYAFAQSAGESVKEFEVDGGSGCVAPSPEAVIDGSYPLSRSLYIYVNEDSLASNDAVRAYVDFYVSATGLNEAVSAVGYVPLPEDRQAATAAAAN